MAPELAASTILQTVFEAIFVGVSLFEAAVWLLGGLLLAGIGLAIFVDSVSFLRRAVKKRVRILGVIRKKQGKAGQSIYWPVYEFMGNSGDLIQTRASSSGSLVENLPGKFRDVRVDPDDPHDVRGLTPTGMIVGVILLVAGAGLFAISNAVNGDMGLVSLVAIALVAVIAVKAIVTGRGGKRFERGRLGRKWRQRQKRKRIPDLSKILTREEHLAALRELDSSRRKWLPIVALVGAAILAFGIWRGRDLAVLQSIGTRAEGTVVRIESEYHSSSEGSGYTHYSVVRFETASGRDVEFRDSVGSSHPIDERGETLGVLYDPGNLERAMIDRGIWNWAIPVGCGLLGGLTFYASLRGAIGAYRRRGSKGFPAGRRVREPPPRSASGCPPSDRNGGNGLRAHGRGVGRRR